VHEIIGKIFFDNVALVAQADDEIMMAVAGIYFHDVP
jgi:hypothetical protein